VNPFAFIKRKNQNEAEIIEELHLFSSARRVDPWLPWKIIFF